MKRKKSFFNLLCRMSVIYAMLMAWSPAAMAIPDSPWTMFLAGAYPFSVGATDKWMGGEYGVLGGFGYQEATWPIGLQFEGMTYRLGFTDDARAFANSDGYMQLTAGTANITWTPEKFKQSSFIPRLIGGIGVYNRVIKTTEVRPYAGTCWDPWWGYYACAGTGTVETASHSQTKFGFNVGTSVGYELVGGGEFFVELRYHHAMTSHEATQILPINFGFRW